MVVQAKTQLYVPCPGCIEGSSRADHLVIGFKTTWSCSKCQANFKIERVSEFDFETSLTGWTNTPVTITLQSITEPKITVKVNAWKYSHSQNDTPEEYAEDSRYYYDEHTCPTNWTRDIVQIEFEGDKDPHGVFKFVSAEDGHLDD
jgi:hypothetical protein